MSEGKFDPHRRLCPDGACVGVIGDDGRCRVCGRTAGGKDVAPAGFVPVGDAAPYDDDDDDQDVDEGEDGAEATKAAGAAGAGFDPNRRLCPDGSCVGVIDAGGICNVCGQKAD